MSQIDITVSIWLDNNTQIGSEVYIGDICEPCASDILSMSDMIEEYIESNIFPDGSVNTHTQEHMIDNLRGVVEAALLGIKRIESLPIDRSQEPF